MPGPKHTLVSALALSLAFTNPAAAQVLQSDYETPEDLPPAVQERLSEFAEACENAEGAAPNLPAGLDCDSVLRLADMQDDAGDTDATPETGETADAAPDQANPQAAGQGEAQDGQAAEAPAETPEADPQAAEAEPEQAETAEGQETEADPSAQNGNADTPAEAAQADQQEPEADTREEAAETVTQEPEATDQAAEADAQDPADMPADQAETGQAAEAPADDAPDPQAAEQDVASEEQTAEQQQDADPQTQEPAATEEPATEEQAAEQAPTDQAGESVAPQTEAEAQAQADAVAQSDNAAAAAAAQQDAQADSAEAEIVEETIAEQDVRQSSEDFETEIDQSTEGAAEAGAQARSEGDDDDDNDTLRNAAILGLGALALSQILGDNAEVVSNSGDRIVVQEGDRLRVLRNDDVLLRRPGAEVQTYRFQDGSTRNVVSYDDGTQVETIRTADGRVLRRSRILRDGSEVVLFDDTQQEEQVVVNELPQTDERRQIRFQDVDSETLADALRAQEAQGMNRAFTLNQVRNIDRVRQLVPEISVTTINFETASAAIRPREAEELAVLGNAMRRMIERDPREVFLIEGHTDAVGNAAYNLALFDRRAESVALALTEYFDVPPANMVLQGYGESDLLVPTTQAERANRRAAVRRITPLLRQSASR